MAHLILIRGLPGSGKTTLARNRYPDYTLVEADMFFEKNGQYNYDAKKIKQAHEWCQKQVKAALDNGENVVVANTFTQLWEMDPYLKMGYPTEIIEATGRYKNIHGVPQKVIEKMKARWETIK